MGSFEIGCRSAFACLFLLAAIGKLRDRAAFVHFAASLPELGAPRRLAGPRVAATIVLGEAAVPPLLLALPPAGYGLALVLLAMFTCVLARALARGSTARCRCFGASGVPIGRAHLARNAALFATAAIGVTAYLGATPVPVGTAGWLGGAGGGALAGLALTRWDDLVFLFAAPKDVRS